MKRVAVLGGGPAGSIAAAKLASAGLETIVLDEKLAWEKPCGGAITPKAYRQYPFLLDNNTPKQVVTETVMAAPDAGAVKMTLPEPLLIYSRYELNGMLLRRAEAAGAKIEKTRVTGLERKDSRWRLKTSHGDLEADYCIAATGARNPLREVGTEWKPADTLIALGYFVPGEQRHADIQFLPQLEGYIWVFPRPGHLSAGICGKGDPARKLRERLERYLREKEIDISNARFYSHLLPSLETPSWRTNRLAGDGWMAVGDAGGLVDPITGEGLYYAIRSADLAAELLVEDKHPLDQLASVYRRIVWRGFGEDLTLAASLARRIFLGNFLFRSIPARTVQYMKRSPAFLAIMQDLVSGAQPYLTLRRRLLENLIKVHSEVWIWSSMGRFQPRGVSA